jgi:hypothetical protein
LIIKEKLKSGREDLNLRPPAPKAGALNQAALRPESSLIPIHLKLRLKL